MGESRRGSHLQLVPGDEMWRFSDIKYERVNLGTSGAVPIYLGETYDFIQYKPKFFRDTESSIRTTGVSNQYRLMFPVVPTSVSITMDGLGLSATTGTPGTLEYRLDHTIGSILLGNSFSSITIEYFANTGPMEVVPLPYTTITSGTPGTLAWSTLSTLATGEYWVRIRPVDTEQSLLRAMRDAGLTTNDSFFLARTDSATAATAEVAASSVGTIIFAAEPGPDGNNWRVVWDTDCIHLLRAPGYEPRRFVLPLTSGAASRWSKSSPLPYPEGDIELEMMWSNVLSDFSGAFAGLASLTPGWADFSGGTSSTTNWADALEKISFESELVYFPLGAGIDDVQLYITDAYDYGVWPIIVLGTTATISPSTVDVCSQIAMIGGEVTYRSGYTGTAAAALAGAINNGLPLYLTNVIDGPPIDPLVELIYPRESVRHGWIVPVANMLASSLGLAHHLWLQTMAREVRATLSPYLGMIVVRPEVVANDASFMAAMAKYNAEYEIVVAKEKIQVSLIVKPPGMASEVQVNVSTQSVV